MKMKPKLFVAIPSLNTWEADTAQCWANCLQYTSAKNIFSEIKFANCRSSDLVSSRTLLAREAISQGATHTFWFDSDIIFPEDSIERLFAHRLPIISAVGRTKHHEYATYALNDQGTSFDARGAQGLHTVNISGFGCIMIETAVFKAIKEPWFGGWWEQKEDEGWVWRFEDVHFCLRAINHGFGIVVDADLSQAIGHKGSCIYWHQGVQLMR